MQGSCNQFVSLDDVLRLVPDIAGLIAAKPCLGGFKSGHFEGFAAIRSAAVGAALILS